MAEGRALGAAAGFALALGVLLAGCASGPRGGRDGGPSQPPADLSQLQDATPRVEPVRSGGGTAKPYTVLGRSYVPITDDRPFREAGLASWYGTKFHAQSTASGEPYDMYAMTAAHKTLPLPSYVRVRNPANGREAIVRVNDRGPFHDGRIIDLSYAAAYKLDLLRGVAPVEIERLTNDDIRAGNWQRNGSQDSVFAVAPRPLPAQPAPVASAGSAAAYDGAVSASTGAPMPSSAGAASANAVAVPGAMVVPAVSTAPVVAAAQPEATALPALAPLPPVAASSAQAGAAGDLPSTGFWVQLGAFSQPSGASGLREQASRGLPSLGPQLKVFNERGLYRVQAGPFASREAAQGTADQLRASLQLSPMVLERR
ncbi:septal ring lytic transglycosylase RlpA family protein [Variovorax sp. OV329]|uniref:septal ring lytic transglycosylase RlpA family protein n=1 Tax=Variovorax sp. OV329 TaxID=1882825 RepID=UPI0008E761AE|nr:septal ring lytic transglycosylase RlpA family protein [Variovorax sp. OV329]SFM32119.1 rare lipoprotein A [Variovorax sp. OV329]